MRLEAFSCDEKDVPKKGGQVLVIDRYKIVSGIFLKRDSSGSTPIFRINFAQPNGCSVEFVHSVIYTDRKDALLDLKKYFHWMEKEAKSEIEESQKSLANSQTKLEKCRRNLAGIEHELAQNGKPVNALQAQPEPEENLETLAGELLRWMKRKE